MIPEFMQKNKEKLIKMSREKHLKIVGMQKNVNFMQMT